MGFTWDPAKNERNIRERGLSFEHAAPMWDAPMLVWIDTRKDYREVRLMALGELEGRVMAVGWVERGKDRRIFTLRKANARETKRYRKENPVQGAAEHESNEP